MASGNTGGSGGAGGEGSGGLLWLRWWRWWCWLRCSRWLLLLSSLLLMGDGDGNGDCAFHAGGRGHFVDVGADGRCRLNLVVKVVFPMAYDF